MRRTLCSRGAFSLVEVAVALGVAAVALAGLFALLHAGAEAERAAEDRAQVAQLAEQVLGSLRGTRFDEFTGPRRISMWWRFDADGQPAKGGNTRYLCRVEVFPDEGSRPFPQGPVYLMRLQINFTWPQGAPGEQQQEQNIYTSVARF